MGYLYGRDHTFTTLAAVRGALVPLQYLRVSAFAIDGFGLALFAIAVARAGCTVPAVVVPVHQTANHSTLNASAPNLISPSPQGSVETNWVCQMHMTIV